MIREQNKEKCLVWAGNNLDEDFGDVIWTDETAVQMENHQHYCCGKKSQKPRYKPQYVATQKGTLIFIFV